GASRYVPDPVIANIAAGWPNRRTLVLLGKAPLGKAETMGLGAPLRIPSVAGIWALAACADLSGNTQLSGEPVVLQEMVTSTSSGLGFLDSLTDGRSGYMIFYGTQADYDLCYFFDPTKGLYASPICSDPAQKCVCPMANGTIPMSCSTSGTYAGHCVDAATSVPPRALHALPFQTSIRIVVGELLEGATLEHFACACQADAIIYSMC